MMNDREALLVLRVRLAAMRAPACGMAHESVRSTPDGQPVRSSQSSTGYARPDICAAPVREGHLGCSHTRARYCLRDALGQVPGEGQDALLRELDDLENAISLLDHRRYDAETQLAQAREAGRADDIAANLNAVAGLTAEHRRYAARVLSLRDTALARLDAALAPGGFDGHIGSTDAGF